MKLSEKVITAVMTIIAVIFICIILMIVFAACNPAKKIAKAEQTVLLDSKARHNVFLNELERFPCANDSVVTYLPGRTDSVLINTITQVPVFDSFAYSMALYNIQDSAQEQCLASIKEAFDLGIETATKEFNKLKIAVKKPDTARYMILDKQAWKLLDDSLQRAEKHIERLKATLISQAENCAKNEAKNNKWMWRSIGTWVVLGIFLALCIYGKISKITLPKFRL